MVYDLLADHFIFNGREFTNHITLFGKLDIYFYALAIVTGIVSCCLLAIPLFKRRGEKPDFILDLMIFIVPLCIVGARLWYVIFDIKSFLKADGSPDFLQMIDIRKGGLAIYGGVCGGALGVFIACKIHKFNVIKAFDFGATMLPLGQAIGRWGNFFNMEVYGQQITDPNMQFFPLAVQIERGGTVGWYQALFFYESVLNLIAFALLYTFMWKKNQSRNGYAVGMYFMAYGLIRGVLENFRQSEYNLPLFGNADVRIPAMVLVSIALFIAGLAIVAVLMAKDGIFKKFGKRSR